VGRASLPSPVDPPCIAMSKAPPILEGTPLTEEETQRLDAIREAHKERIAQHNVHYLTLLRFLRGYKDDPKPLEKSIDMLGKMLTWREEQKVDEIVASVLPRGDEFRKIWPSGVHGFGKEGNLIYIDRVGQVEPSKLMGKNGFTMDDVQKFHIQMMEGVNRMKEQQYAATGKVKYKNLVILDLDGLGMGHMGSKFTAPMKSFIKIDQEYYPESLYQMVITNAGWVLKTLWAMVSPWIDPITASRIKFGSAHLTEFIDEEQIPKFLKGKCKCEGGKCLEVPFIAGYDPPRPDLAGAAASIGGPGAPSHPAEAAAAADAAAAAAAAAAGPAAAAAAAAPAADAAAPAAAASGDSAAAAASAEGQSQPAASAEGQQLAAGETQPAAAAAAPDAAQPAAQ